MAKTFDHGLAKPHRTLIRDGAVTLLSGLERINGGYLQFVGKFGAVIRSWTDADGVDQLFDALSGQAPAIVVAVGDSTSKEAGTGGFGWTDDFELFVYHVTNHARDMVIGRQAEDPVALVDDAADPGLDVMMAHAKELLVGQRCGVSHATMKQVKPDREEELLTKDGVTVWLQSYRIRTALTIKEFRNVTQLLESIGIRTIQEAGEVNLPAAKTKETTIDAVTTDLNP